MHAVIFALMFLLFLGPAWAQKPHDKESDLTRKRVGLLIEQLASQNTAPPVVGSFDDGEEQLVKFPEKYDRSLQVPVYCAYQALLAEEDTAIDLLLDHAEDTRYSYSVNSFRDYNVSVGNACQRIASAMLIGFEEELHVISRDQEHVFPPADPFGKNKRRPDLLDYWRQRRELGVPRVQVQAIDSMLEYFRNADGKTARPWHAQAEPLELIQFNRLRDENIRTLTAIRRQITETGKRYRTNRIDGAYHCMIGLPWSARKFNK